MNRQDQVRDNYDRIAGDYAAHLFGELERKPFDRSILQRFNCQIGAAGGMICDLGCGPGQVARFLQRGGARVFGLDLSSGMIAEARRRNPETGFVQGSMLGLPLQGGSLGGIAAFYSIVHLPTERLPQAFSEMLRVLRAGGRLLLAFHVGTEVITPETLWGHSVSLAFCFFDPEQIRGLVESAGFTIETVEQRPPYAPEVEHQSHRAYLTAVKP